MTFIASSYIKYLESSGARVVHINHNANEEQLKNIMN